MKYIIKFLDLFAAIGTIICLNYTVKSYKFWLYYTILTIAFIIVVIYKQLTGQTILGLFLLFTGIRNYYLEKKKYE